MNSDYSQPYQTNREEQFTRQADENSTSVVSQFFLSLVPQTDQSSSFAQQPVECNYTETLQNIQSQNQLSLSAAQWNNFLTLESPQPNISCLSWPNAFNFTESNQTTVEGQGGGQVTASRQNQTTPLQVQIPTPRPGGRDRYRSLSSKQKFLVFVKVLFKVIEQQNDRAMLLNAKAVVAKCAQRNRVGDRNYMPLQEATSIRLRLVVGESYWDRAMSYFLGV